MPEPGREPVTVSMQLGDGSSKQFYGALADFGPMFEAGCSDARSGGGSAGSSGGGGSTGGSGEEGTAPRRGKASSERQPPEPSKQLQWQGLPLVARQGGGPERPWRVVYVLAGQRPGRAGGQQQEAADDDPYEDAEGQLLALFCGPGGGATGAAPLCVCMHAPRRPSCCAPDEPSLAHPPTCPPCPFLRR